METPVKFTTLIFSDKCEQLEEIVTTYRQSLPLIIQILSSDKSSATQKKSALMMLEHFNSRLQELHNQL